MRPSTVLSIPGLGIENLNAHWGQAAARLGRVDWMGPERWLAYDQSGLLGLAPI